MTFQELFKSVVEKLEKEGVRYALAGGLAVSVYRKRFRATDDLDFLILADHATEEVASKIIRHFKMVPAISRKADLEGGPKFAIKRKSSTECIVIGRNKNDETAPGLDFILPGMLWFDSALERAEKNVLDFDVAKVPTLTVEDMILAKFYSLYNDSTRTDDLSDLKSIFEANHDLDLAYIGGKMRELKIRIPTAIKKATPKILVRVSNSIKAK